ncbi:MAG: TonB-dependent receptor plug domain-containing protein [Bacteroidota bacterium]
MKRLNIGITLGLSALILMSIGCASSRSSSSQAEYDQSREYSNYWTLEDYLRRANGVQLYGSGDDIHIIIRGHKSVNNPFSQPLFVVDGQKAGRNYARVASMFSRGDIISVKVLPAGASAQYGMEGNYGVIEIESRRLAKKS